MEENKSDKKSKERKIADEAGEEKSEYDKTIDSLIKESLEMTGMKNYAKGRSYGSNKTRPAMRTTRRDPLRRPNPRSIEQNIHGIDSLLFNTQNSKLSSNRRDALIAKTRRRHRTAEKNNYTRSKLVDVRRAVGGEPLPALGSQKDSDL
jgi:hypothetical protein